MLGAPLTGEGVEGVGVEAAALLVGVPGTAPLVGGELVSAGAMDAVVVAMADGVTVLSGGSVPVALGAPPPQAPSTRAAPAIRAAAAARERVVRACRGVPTMLLTVVRTRATSAFVHRPSSAVTRPCGQGLRAGSAVRHPQRMDVVVVPPEQVRASAAAMRGAASALSAALDAVLGAGAAAQHALSAQGAQGVEARMRDVTAAVDAVVVSWQRVAEGFDTAVDVLVEQDGSMVRRGPAGPWRAM